MEFTPGVVAIVGPNGCGKSNISDAIRWALGEQSARPLRGASMQDVIFSGTQNRRGLGFAEVTLVFDNEDKYLPLDYSEVTVTRKLFKSGESEFYLNGVACRLKDIVDVFLGTGLGKETYSVVEQGRIDAILSLRPEDRRALFDEAAGIMRFRLRKKEAERKLENVQDNQLRITDLTQELANQLPLLSIQAQTARKYNELNEKLQKNELTSCCLKIQNLSNDLGKIRPVIQELIYKETELNTQITEFESKIETMKVESVKYDGNLEELFVKNSQAVADVQKHEGLLNLLKERAEVLTERINTLNDNLEEIENKKINLQEQKESITASCEKSGMELSDLKTLTEQLEEEYTKFISEMNQCSENVNLLKDDMFTIMSDLAQSRNEKTSIISSRTGFDARIERINTNITNRRELLSQTESIIVRSNEEKNETLEHIEKLKCQIRAYNDEANELKDHIKIKEQSQFNEDKELSQIRATHQALYNLEEQHEGYGRAVKKLFSTYHGKEKGLIGVVSEVIKVPKQFEAAIEAALGGAIQNIVAINDENAQKAVEFLKTSKSGRATFLPLNMLSVNKLSKTEIPENNSGFIGVGCDLVECDITCRRAVEYLLGRVVIASDLKAATFIKKNGFKGKIVTLDGDVISGGGAITGGETSEKQTGLLARTRKIRELAQLIEEKTQILAQAETQLSDLKVKYDLKIKDINVLIEQINDYTVKIRAIDENIKSNSNERDRIRKDISDMLEEISFIEETKKSSETNLCAIEEKIETLSALYESKTKSFEEMNSKFALMKSKEPDISGKLTSSKVSIAEKKAEHTGFITEQSRVKNLIFEIEEKIRENISEVENLSAQLENLNKEKEKIKQETGELNVFCNKLQIEIDEVRVKKASLLDESKKKETKLRSMRRNQMVIHEDLQLKKIQEAKLCAELDSETSKLYNDFELSLDKALETKLTSKDYDEIKQECDSIRSEIADLGPINHTAVEEYEALSNRYNFLEDQLKDLEQAGMSLLEVIKETEKACKKQFAETFEQINEAFKEVFVKLFGGGEAYLKLEDTSNVLDCGIDIICQPPGKKLASLALLSGGERALTAISLLFAIVKVRPSPFCVLDEIDSALDEGNVNRFADLIKDFSQMIQVILVTHRKGTMECADYLYGVTMEESGISKVFSVRPE